LDASRGPAGGRTIAVSRILAPTDFSSGATRALQWAVTLNTAFHAELIVLHVVDLDALAFLDLGGDPALGGTSQPVSAGTLERLRAEAEHALARLTAPFPGIRSMLREGSPREAILQVAEEVSTDLIVMGTHGRSGLARVAFGGVADHIIRHSTIPVFTVRET
jgi:nucleotide-binding universal stress UspA family protein